MAFSTHIIKAACCLLAIGTYDANSQEHNPAQFAAPASAAIGFYQYGQAIPDPRHPHAAIMIGKPKRQQYDFFSAQEEQALWAYLEQQKEALVKISEPAITFKRKIKKIVVNPVRVLIKDGKVCVPTLEKSESAEWQDFLVCTGMKGKQ